MFSKTAADDSFVAGTTSPGIKQTMLSGARPVFFITKSEVIYTLHKESSEITRPISLKEKLRKNRKRQLMGDKEAKFITN